MEKLKAESVVRQQAAAAKERARLLLEKRSADPSSSSSSLRRKRKKRRRKKVPKTSSSRSRLPARAALRSRRLRGDPGFVVSVRRRVSSSFFLGGLLFFWAPCFGGFPCVFLSGFIMDAGDVLIPFIPVKAMWIQRFLPLSIPQETLRRVFIMDTCDVLIPLWLKFVSWIQRFLPLSISRKILQFKALHGIKTHFVMKCLDLLQKLPRHDDYDKVHEQFGKCSRLGCMRWSLFVSSTCPRQLTCTWSRCPW